MDKNKLNAGNAEEKDKTPKENVEGLKAEANNSDGVKKGYNEKNPTQPQGAFPADSNEEVDNKPTD